MNTPTPYTGPLGVLSEDDQKKIFDWLTAIHPALHELYQSFCALAYGPPIPGRGRLIAHCIREVRNCLLWHAVAKETAKIDYPRETVDKLAEEWGKVLPGLDLSLGHEAAQSTTQILIDVRVLAIVHTLVEQHNSTIDTQLVKITRLFESFQIVKPADSTPLSEF